MITARGVVDDDVVPAMKRAKPATRRARVAPELTGPASLVLAAAAEIGAADLDPQLWRDQAVLLAVEQAWAADDLVTVGAIATGYDALLLYVPAPAPGGLALHPVGNAERRHRGAFSTPAVYADSLARRAIPELPDGELPTVVDPACGAGNLLRAALSRLLSLGVPPEQAIAALHGVDADPIAVSLCRSALAADLSLAGRPTEPAELEHRIRAGDGLSGATPNQQAAGAGLTWHEAFPQVLGQEDAAPEPVTGWRGGFDVVVANPPWERLKVHARDWGGEIPVGLRDRRAGTARALRDAGRHPLTGAGELNAYLPFVETCWRLLAPGGRASLLVPAGIASDRSAARLLEALCTAGALGRLHLIEPRGPIFAGVSGRVGVAIVELRGGPARETVNEAVTGGADADPAPGAADPIAGPVAPEGPSAAEVAVGLAGPDQPAGERAWRLPAHLLRVVNPNTATAPLFASATDAGIVTAAHRRTPVLLRRDPASAVPTQDPWKLRLVTPLHMTRDARHFRSGPGEGLVPLWEAKHCAMLDPNGGTATAPRYWVPMEVVRERYGDLCDRGWLAGYRNVSTTVAPRTLLPTPLPVVAVGNSLPLISADRLPLLLAALSTLPVDYLLRQKHAGANVNFFKLEQVPVPPPEAYDVPSPWGDGTIADWVLTRFARAVTWSDDLHGLAAELGRSGIEVPGRPDPEGVLTARAELDAAHALLLGFDRAELTHLLGTFTALRRQDETRHGGFVTADRVLRAYDRLKPV
ncbi:N-6 DNA methylase [Kineosporia sp. J2-2]|uniref:site-specific DNA-methyltransferase (adenine-specific) n=1 Tax=Kineosporia corallincola TaxID=2835133 RepID=A0ABS5TA24_9ACTN|nr:N-6 DNA methylase [Kineosporia corallincola]MBT0767917.1 N-6 DNA methylase [Kineosporia corallincola]